MLDRIPFSSKRHRGSEQPARFAKRCVHSSRENEGIQFVRSDPMVIRGCGSIGGRVQRKDIHFPDQVGKDMACMERRAGSDGEDDGED